MKNLCLAAALRELADAGVHNVIRSYGGKHIQLRWRANGRGERVYTVPVTPSDRRSHFNTRAAIRRLLRADGVITESVKPSQPVSAPPPDRFTLLEMRVRALELALEKLQAPK
jgi:hypothetical protein